MAQVVKDLTEAEKDRFKEIHKKCMDDPATSADEDLLKKVHQGVYTDDEKVKVHMLCMAKGLKFLTEDGKLNTDWVKNKWEEHYNGDDLTKLNACLVQKDTPVETSWALLKCQHEAVGATHHHHLHSH